MSKTEPTTEELAERVRELEQRQARIPSPQEVKEYVEQLPITRRQLGMAIGAGMVSVPAIMADISRASQGSDGDPYACVWLGDQNADGHDLDNVGNLTFEGSGGGTVTGGRWGETDTDGLLEILNSGISGIDVGTVNTERLLNTTGDGDSWLGLWDILLAGGVVAYDGSLQPNVYSGTNAVQRALNDVDHTGARIFVGDSENNYSQGHYDPIVIKSPYELELVGLGHQSHIKGTTTHACEINNSISRSTSLARYYLSKLKLGTPSGGGNAVDCLHQTTADSGQILYEGWFGRIEFQESDRHAINLQGTSNANIVSQKFSRPFGEGIDQQVFLGNQYTREISVDAFEFTTNATKAIDFDGDQFVAIGHTLNGNVVFGVNSDDCFLLCPDTNISVTNNGTAFNSWVIRGEMYIKNIDLVNLRNGPNLLSPDGTRWINIGDGASQINNKNGNKAFEIAAGIDVHQLLDFRQGGSETADSMTANPEADAEDGYIDIELNNTAYQIPIYSP